jgi:hypothetical protein
MGVIEWKRAINTPDDERWAEDGADQEHISAGDFLDAAIFCVVCAQKHLCSE